MRQESFGETLKILRLARGWSQGKLAMKAGITRSVIATIETRKDVHPRGDILIKLARAFGVSVEELYQGNLPQTKEQRAHYDETPEELLERFKLAQPVSIPVYGEFHAGTAHKEPVDRIYIARLKAAKKSIEAFIVHGHCMEPKIEDGDIVVVDRDRPGEVGNIVLCLLNGELVCGKVRKDGDTLYIRNSAESIKLCDCTTSAVVIQIIKQVG